MTDQEGWHENDRNVHYKDISLTGQYHYVKLKENSSMCRCMLVRESNLQRYGQKCNLESMFTNFYFPLHFIPWLSLLLVGVVEWCNGAG